MSTIAHDLSVTTSQIMAVAAWCEDTPTAANLELAQGESYIMGSHVLDVAQGDERATFAPSGELLGFQTWTVLACYDESGQPYATTVGADTPAEAIEAAQYQALIDNEVSDEYKPGEDFGSYTLTGFHVLRGNVRVVA